MQIPDYSNYHKKHLFYIALPKDHFLHHNTITTCLREREIPQQDSSSSHQSS
uniref:Uncharacterized protein n=1 Tax=Manihot esculenta TaxID=3983 RepID=A0A2C9WEZ3_MANES